MVTQKQASLAIIMFVIIGVAVALFLYLGLICADIAQYIILFLTLIAVLFYAFFTLQILEVEKDVSIWNQNPVLVSSIRPKLETYIMNDGKSDFKTFFSIRNVSRVHAIAKINIRPQVGDNEKEATSNDKYSGKRWWYVPAHQSITGWFPVREILESVKTDICAFESKSIPLKLSIKVIYKRWEQRGEKQMLGNPPQIWYYDHSKGYWVHEPTTSEIEFQIDSKQE